MHIRSIRFDSIQFFFRKIVKYRLCCGIIGVQFYKQSRIDCKQSNEKQKKIFKALKKKQINVKAHQSMNGSIE